MYLGFVSTRAHHPLPIFTDSYTRTCFFEFEILQQFDAICIVGIILETSLAFLLPEVVRETSIWMKERVELTRASQSGSGRAVEAPDIV
jgi:hypothetical protein